MAPAGGTSPKPTKKEALPRGGLETRSRQNSALPCPGGSPTSRMEMPPMSEWLFLCPIIGVGSTEGDVVGSMVLQWV